jgi:hypothetical protein
MSEIANINNLQNGNGNSNEKYISICPHCRHLNHFHNDINIKTTYCYGCSCSIEIIKSIDKTDFLYEEMPEDYEDEHIENDNEDKINLLKNNKN